MGRVLTNNITLAYTVETSLGVAGTDWVQTEPNDVTTFGAEITTVAREPISQNRQRRKGTTTDLDSSIEFEADWTISSFRDFIEGFCFANAINVDVTQIAASNPETTGDTYTVPALTADQATKFVVGTLVWVTGFSTTANIYLKQVDTAATAADTSIAVSDNLVNETGTGRLSFAGYRVPALTAVTWTWDAANSRATLSATGLSTQLQALGLFPGQLVHIGSVASLGGAIQNGFTASAFGYARVRSFSGADDVILDKVDAALQASQTDPATPLDIVFGEFVRNVPVGTADYIERSFQFEAAFPNLGDGTVGNTDESYQYSLGNFCNTVGFELPLTNKAIATFAFIGTDTENPTTTRKTGADAALVPNQVAALNSTSDIARLRITEIDEDGLTTDFKSLTMTLNNNVSPEKVIGQLGARFINTGNFNVDIEAQLLFTSPRVVNAIRDNETLTMDFIVKNDDGVISIDIPAMTLGGGDREFPVNESVLINTTAQAFGDPIFGTSIGVSIIPVPLP